MVLTSAELKSKEVLLSREAKEIKERTKGLPFMRSILQSYYDDKNVNYNNFEDLLTFGYLRRLHPELFIIETEPADRLRNIEALIAPFLCTLNETRQTIEAFESIKTFINDTGN